MAPSTVTVMLATNTRVGRTSAVANSAWKLALAGNRVLVLDADDRGRPVTDYLAPYRTTVSSQTPLTDASEERDLRSWYDELFLAARSRPAGPGDRPTTTQHRLPDGVAKVDVLTLPRTVPLFVSPAAPTGKSLRGVLSNLPYDHVLVEFPAGNDEHIVTQAAELADHVVICLRALSHQLTTANDLRSDLLYAINRAGLRRPRLSGIITFLSPADPREAAPLISRFRDVFLPRAVPQDRSGSAPGDTTTGSDGAFCVPFRNVGAGAPLEVLFPPGPADQPAQAGSLPDPATAYEHIAEALAGGVLPVTPAFCPSVRDRYRRAVGAQGVAAPVSLTVLHQPVDRPMAEWLQDSLEPRGVGVRSIWRQEDLGLLAPDAPLVILEPEDDGLGDRVPDEATDRIRVRWDRRAVELQQTALPRDKACDGSEIIDLRGLAGDVAAAVVARRLGVGGSAGSGRDTSATEVRFPPDRRRTVRRSFLPRNEHFVGRDAELDDLRDSLRPAGEFLVRTIHGPAGAGKSELAREYTHRFEYAYDIVWWIEATDVVETRASLTTLGRVLSVRSQGDLPRSTLSELAATQERWLLVYDGVTDPSVLNDLLPTGGRGHVLVTSRTNMVPGSQGTTLGDLSESDAVALFEHRVTNSSTENLERIVTTIGTCPLIVDLASRWLASVVAELRSKGYPHDQACNWATEELIERHRHFHGAASVHGGSSMSQVPDPRISATTALLRQRWEMSLPGRLAMAIGRFCTHLSARGVNFDLLSSPPMLEQLARSCEEADARNFRADTNLLHQALWTGSNLGLLDLTWARRIRLRSRDLVGQALYTGTSPQEREKIGSLVRQGLAGAAPTDAAGDDSAWHPRLDELGRHLVACGAPDSDDDAVRRWVVRQVRHHYLNGDVAIQRSILDLAIHIRQRWTADQAQPDPALLRLGTQVANLYRGLGDDPGALRVDQEVIAAQRRDLGTTHPRTLMTARGLAADLRGMGRFEESLREDTRTFHSLRNVYGPDHLETLKAEHDLCLSLGMAGRSQEAARRGRLVLRRIRRIQGEDHTLAWQGAVQLAAAWRELGDLPSALKVLLRAEQDLRSSDKEPGQGLDLLLSNGICVVRRDQGSGPRVLDTHEMVLDSYRSLHGDNHSSVLICMLALAGHYHVCGKTEYAVSLAGECLGRTQEARGPGHPFTATCRSSLGLFHRAAGEIDLAVDTSLHAVRDLTDRLGPRHPWTIAARMILAGSHVANGDLPSAEKIETDLVRQCRAYLPTTHPYTVGCRRNLALTRRGILGSTPDAEPHRTGRSDPLVEIPQT